ncbi:MULTISPECIES: SDR family oxidoreductase [unclassified Myxococcus]|uniref:SDR family oxidoreductase n=1 Tax=unclassified Myxococcus TaxID=2648731 RepID=UPI00157A4F37|nr:MULTISPECIES: SDR family oxidoreductase [unclassified Myxococcus]NTX36890.1 SDR family oxidoreductase [Myxococcus sp. CA033]NTX51605.1 SDR family oxidoreductase [Myxococcus sp. CA039A]
MKILVTGATGSIGSQVIQQLRARDASFRAFVRDRSKGESLGGDFVVGDFDSPESLRAALQGVDRVLLNGTPSEGLVRQHRAVIDAAKQAGVSHVVRISTRGASTTTDFLVGRWHGEADAYLEASGLGWTALRPTYFMQNLLRNAESIRNGGRFFGAFGTGRIAFIDSGDIARSAVAQLTHASPHSGAHSLTGPEALTFDEFAAKLSARLGKPVAYVDRPVSEVIENMRAQGFPEAMLGSFKGMFEAFAKGAASQLATGVKDLTGTEPRTLDAFLADHAESFR